MTWRPPPCPQGDWPLPATAPHHFFHCYAGGEWREPVAEHLFALDQAGFDGPVTVGLVGPGAERALAGAIFRAVYPRARLLHAESGFEHLTLRAVARYAKTHDGQVMYAHTKGAGHPGPFQAQWRRSMTARLVPRWRENTRILDSGWVDVLGSHWMVPGVWAWHPEWPSPFFAGNFWQARCDYLRALPRIGRRRFDAEKWIGLGRPSVADLLPGFPTPDSCPLSATPGRLQVQINGRTEPRLG